MTRSDDFDSSKYIRTMSNLIFPIIMGIGVGGNAMVIMVIFNTKGMRSSTNIFLANLAIADLVNLLLLGTLSFVDMFSPGILDTSEGVCKIIPMIAEIMTFSSVLTVLAIGFERYYAICQPLKAGYICTKNWAYKICLLSWPLAALSSSPYLSIMVYHEGKDINGTSKGLCQIQCDTFWRKSYAVTSALVFFIIPLVIITVLYVIIVQNLNRASKAPNVNVTVIRHRRQVLGMLATVVLCFFLCQLPFRGFTLFLISVPAESEMWLGTQGYYNWLLFGRAMIYLHSAVNPILYSLMSKRFRMGFKRICCDIGLRRSGSLAEESTNTTTMDMSTSNN